MKLRRANALLLNTLPLNTLPLNTLILLATTLTICLPTAAAAQTTLGSVALGATSTSVVSIALPAAARLASISVGTQGAAYLDFANAGGGSCRVGVSYAAGATCTVKVAFTPKFAGARYGAVVLASSTGVVATAYLQGVGNGPQVSYLPGTLTTVKSGSEAVTNGVAADASGNYYIPDSSHRRVLKETLKNGVYVETSIGTNLTSPYAVAVDGAGNLFVANIAIPSLGIQAGSLFKETLLDGKYIESEIAIPFNSLSSVAVDGAGNVFVVDGDMTIDELSPVPGGYSVTNLPPAPFSGAASLNGVYAVAVDGFGNLYVTISYLYDNYGGTIIKYAGELYKYTLSNGVYTPTTGFFLTGFPATVAVDGDGDIYLANSKLNSLWAEIGVTEFLPQPNGTYYEIAIPMQAYDPIGVAVDGAGNVFIVDGGVTNSGAGTPTITRVARSTPPSLDFASTPFGSVQEGPYNNGTAPTSPQTVTLLNSGNAPLALSGIDYPADFTPFPYLDAPPASDCFLGQSVASRQTCNLFIDFSPEQPLNGKTSIAIKEAVTLDTNAPVAGTPKSISVAGIETRPTGTLTLFASSDPYQPGQSLTFTATVTAPSGLPTPTGTVTFSDGENIPVICKSTLTAGVATCVTSALSGSQVLGAVYSGDSIYADSSTQLQMEQATSPVPPSGSVANFGSVNIGSSVTLPVTFTFTSSQTVAAISVTTGGSYNLDFTGQTGGTCAAGVTYGPGAACTVNVRFAPRTSGQIRGAVQLDGTSAAWIANAYIRGVGVGPQTVFSPGTRTKLASLGAPAGLAVDESGRLIVAAQGLLSQQASAGSASFSKIGGYGWECNSTAGIALDGAGNLVLASGTCYSGFVVYAQVQGVSGLTYISSQMISPQGVAVDAAGSAYVADQATGILYKLTPAAGSYSQTEIASGFLHPLGVAADASGNLYIADFGSGPDGPSGAVYKETLQPNGTYLRSSIGSGWTSPSAIAVDTMGSVYVADFGNILTGGAVPGSVVKETPAGATYKASPLGGWFPGSNAGPNQGWIAPTGIAVDRFGNVYVADEGDGNIYEQPGQPTLHRLRLCPTRRGSRHRHRHRRARKHRQRPAHLPNPRKRQESCHLRKLHPQDRRRIRLPPRPRCFQIPRRPRPRRVLPAPHQLYACGTRRTLRNPVPHHQHPQRDRSQIQIANPPVERESHQRRPDHPVRSLENTPHLRHSSHRPVRESLLRPRRQIRRHRPRNPHRKHAHHHRRGYSRRHRKPGGQRRVRPSPDGQPDHHRRKGPPRSKGPKRHPPLRQAQPHLHRHHHRLRQNRHRRDRLVRRTQPHHHRQVHLSPWQLPHRRRSGHPRRQKLHLPIHQRHPHHPVSQNASTQVSLLRPGRSRRHHSPYPQPRCRASSRSKAASRSAI